MHLRFPFFLLLSLSPVLASAHHGQDFLLVESAGVPHPGDAYLLGNATAALESGTEDQASVAPALLLGLTSRVAFELHAHTEKLAGESWSYEATAPALHMLLTDPERHEGLRAGASIEYEFAAEKAASDNAEARLSLEQGHDAMLWGANLIASHAQGGEEDYGAALGVRRVIRTGLALGLEAQGSFRHVAGSEMLAGLYVEKGSLLALKFGIGGLREEDEHITPFAQFGLVYRLKD